MKLATSRASTVHTVAACLCPDGSRSFKVNGKSKSGKELKVRAVRDCPGAPLKRSTQALASLRHCCTALHLHLPQEFLRGLGICLDSAGAVVKQAQVTRMADLNSPTELAAVVADASGLGAPSTLLTWQAGALPLLPAPR